LVLRLRKVKKKGKNGDGKWAQVLYIKEINKTRAVSTHFIKGKIK
jgi:hypothetical protein